MALVSWPGWGQRLTWLDWPDGAPGGSNEAGHAHRQRRDLALLSPCNSPEEGARRAGGGQGGGRETGVVEAQWRGA